MSSSQRKGSHNELKFKVEVTIAKTEMLGRERERKGHLHKQSCNLIRVI